MRIHAMQVMKLNLVVVYPLHGQGQPNEQVDPNPIIIFKTDKIDLAIKKKSLEKSCTRLLQHKIMPLPLTLYIYI